MAEGEAAGLERCSAAGMGKEAVVADANEALGQDVKEKAAGELGEGEDEGSGS